MRIRLCTVQYYSQIKNIAKLYADVSAAFPYYLENDNEGRPIILAGFSQGADMCFRLMSEFFDDIDVPAKKLFVMRFV